MSVSYPGQSLKCVNVTTLGPRTLYICQYKSKGVQLRMLSNRGGSKKLSYQWGGGGGPSLTDVLVVFNFLQSVPIDYSKGTKISNEGGWGSPSFLGAVG